MNSEKGWQREEIDMCNHRWLIRMLSEMSEFAKLNGLPEVCAAMDLAKDCTTAAISDYEQKIVQSRNAALSRMMR
jgi:hypothetical protein